MHISENNISDLIVRHLKGQLNAEQEKDLQNWIQNSGKQELFDSIVSKERMLSKSFAYDEFNQEEAWNKLEKQIKSSLDYKKWLAYVAVLLIPMAIGFLLLHKTPEYEVGLADVQQIEPGSSNAVIYFSNGEVVDLSKDTSGVIRSKENLLVERDSNQLKINDEELLAGEAYKMNRIVTPIGGEFQVNLPDGTKVWMNADSYLEFPSKFSGKERKVIAKGELYFDVKSNKDWPFIVETNGMELKVLGTEFNVRAYDDEAEILSTLVEGSVKVKNTRGEQILLSPGHQAVIDKGTNSLKSVVANIEEVTAWKNGQFIFDSRRLENIMYDLARWYDIKVFFANSTVKDKIFSVDVQRYGQIEDVLSLIEGTGDAKFTIKGKVITVE
ncbi:FecR domain-containing protein [Marinifilum fragile]|uniref:FecR family protein n=1 Tax=Marinifilum fragile TaxID=570161 RepID=UPI002AA6106F|nr:FecR domain-containing protein [Marinifilum fragile]